MHKEALHPVLQRALFVVPTLPPLGFTHYVFDLRAFSLVILNHPYGALMKSIKPPLLSVLVEQNVTIWFTFQSQDL